MDGRKNNKGTRGNKGGNPGYGQLEFIKENANRVLPQWWTEIEKMMKSKKMEVKKFALQELNKIQVKMIPQTLASDPNNPLQVGVIILPQRNGDKMATDAKTK